ncbi:MAG TPA: DNA polymerase IV, partial [Nitrospirales bacterium]
MRIVAHIDMDAFFAAVEERDTPRFRGLPLAVGADPESGKGRGVVAAANYKAREYGIHSAMPISTAWRLSEDARRKGQPPVVFLSVDMKKYAAVSARVMAIVRSFAPVVEEAGIDEIYCDLSSSGSYAKAEEVCRAIKQEIQAKERLTASVGIGPKTEAELAKLGIRLVKDFRRFTRQDLQEMFGKRGVDFYDEVRGQDESPIEEHYEPKSIGEEETFDQDTRDAAFIGERLKTLCQEVLQR